MPGPWDPCRDHPDGFDLSRRPDPHVGFGGGDHFGRGVHIPEVMLGALADELGRVSVFETGEPEL